MAVVPDHDPAPAGAAASEEADEVHGERYPEQMQAMIDR